MVTEILDPEQTENYLQTCPELFKERLNIFGLMEDFQWGEDYQESFSVIAEYFRSHPEQYQTALEFGKRLSKGNVI